MKIITKKNHNIFVKLELSNIEDKLIDKSLIINFSDKTARMVFNKHKYNYETLYKRAIALFTQATGKLLIDVKSFHTDELSDINEIIQCFTYAYHFVADEAYSLKKDHKPYKYEHSLLVNSQYSRVLAKKANIIAESISYVKKLQVMPPNICTSVYLADKIVDDVNSLNIKGLQAKWLGKPEMEALGMNLLLGVNKGSSHDARLVVINYSPKPNVKLRKVYVGKGITFDSGGYNIKIRDWMLGMKFDMSGAAIVASSVMAIAKLGGKFNVSAVLAITDNRVANDAITPDMVIKAMNGLNVEIENTDAEGRLVLSDALTYAAKELKASTIVDAATLTGSVVTALGSTYTGVWSTSDAKFEKFQQAADVQKELIWRMPLHDDFHKGNLETVIADIKNCSEKTLSDSNDAAMYLKQFTEGVDYIHCDIAGTADKSGKPMGVLVKTLVEFGL